MAGAHVKAPALDSMRRMSANTCALPSRMGEEGGYGRVELTLPVASLHPILSNKQ